MEEEILFREIKQFTQDQTARKWQCWGLTLDLGGCKPIPLTICFQVAHDIPEERNFSSRKAA